MIEQLAAMLKYEAYKNSGVEWLGKIPAHWDITRLGTRFEERRQKVSDKDFHPLSVTKNGILPQLETAAKTNDGDNRKLVRKGDFVINSRSDRKGSSGVSDRDGSVSLINIVLEPKGIQPQYCQYLLKSYAFIEEFYRMGHGIVADLWTTRYDEMKAVIMGVPPFPEQIAIAAFLDRKTAQMDQAVAIKEKQIALLKEHKQILIQNAVTRGLNPSAPMRDSGVKWIGEIPAHWICARLKMHSKIQSGITLGKSYLQQNFVEMPYIRVANVQSGYFKLDDIATISVPNNEIPRYLLQNGDILVTEGGDIDKLGRGTVWRDEIKPCLHQNHVFAIRVNQSILSQDFVSNFLATDMARKYFIDTATKTTNLASTNRTHLGNLYLPLPSLTEQAAIVAHIETESTKIDRAISIQQQQIDKLKEYKATLINSAVTGKIRVPALVESSAPELSDSLVA
ncbi:restriction endonuclease subunit S [Methylomicrobium sp. Wu6]|uniref:restriction endonuclease subunit S n=1 Tax=Methylomicrobium sp. Wu6 TaxID=3107928 RepID=UPI002DD630AA|nr:restriction endonuclease subunit S [Methylomicrobium sp. Wu6]MEC4748568.1 restriction endonuclease subunit S [Methylomicrobium sp. Wu6]